MKYKIIINPTSGRGVGRQVIPLITQELSTMKLDFACVVTERCGHAIELAEQASQEGFDVVVAVGGDGTSNEVLNGLMHAKQTQGVNPIMGVIAVGRGNDFAYGMGVPAGWQAGCHTLAQGKPTAIDIGRVVGGDYPQGRFFGNGIGIGFDAVVGFVAAKMTHLSGFPNYIVSALKTIFLYYHAPLIRVEFGDQVLEINALMVSIMNGRRMGGGFYMAPQANKNDGLLDLCIAPEVSRMRIITLIPHFLRGSQGTQAEIITGKTNRITIAALRGALPAHADGETLCTEGKNLAIEILPRQIELFCPLEESNQ